MASRLTKEKVEQPLRGTMRSEYKALTRKRLAEAALAEFEERGYASCTIEDIARRAGTSRATFYVHFDGKVELIEGAWDLVRRDLVVLYREFVRAEIRDRLFIESWLGRTFAFYEKNRLRLLAIHEAITLEKELAEVYYERTNELADFIVPLLRERAELTEEEARCQAALLTIQHERFCFLWILRGLPFDRDAVIPTLGRQWYEQLGTDGPGDR
ncbi:TetR/AcrR family transcriptional regulator [Rhodococcus koreensis]